MTVSPDHVETIPDLIYAEVDGQSLFADLPRPPNAAHAPVVVHVHGGGFEVGSRTDRANERLRAAAEHGLAVLSIDYRLAPAVAFPQPLHDVKAAIRWLRASGADLGLDTTRLGIWGASAGALLAAHAAFTATGLTGHAEPELEGTIGDHLEQSSRIDAALLWFGVYDLQAAITRSWLERILMPSNFERALLGVDSGADHPDLVERASPLGAVTGAAPPTLLVHGDRDRISSIAQSQTLHAELVRAGATSTLVLLGGAGHEDEAFETPTNLSMTAAFFASHLRCQPASKPLDAGVGE